METATPEGGQINRLKTLWREGRANLGAIATIPSVQTVQIMARAGLDWIVIDMEHGLAPALFLRLERRSLLSTWAQYVAPSGQIPPISTYP